MMMDAVILESNNIDLLIQKSKKAQAYSVYGLEHFVDRPTRITQYFENLVDHFYVNTNQQS